MRLPTGCQGQTARAVSVEARKSTRETSHRCSLTATVNCPALTSASTARSRCPAAPAPITPQPPELASRMRHQGRYATVTPQPSWLGARMWYQGRSATTIPHSTDILHRGRSLSGQPQHRRAKPVPHSRLCADVRERRFRSETCRWYRTSVKKVVGIQMTPGFVQPLRRPDWRFD